MDTLTWVNRLVDCLSNPILDVLSWICLVCGICFAVQALLIMIAQTQGKTPHNIKKIVISLGLSAVLLSLDTVMTIGSETLFGQGHQVSYASLAYKTGQTALDQQVALGLKCLLRFLTIVGWIAFVNGWFVLKAAWERRGQATIAGGLCRLIGGIFCVNSAALLQLIQQTIGFELIH